MPDESKLRKRIILRVAGHPLTLLPFIMGMTALTATWALNWNPGIGLFAGLARRGEIRVIGYTESFRVSNHARVLRVWVRT